MRKFWLKLVCFFLIVGGPLLAVNHAYKSTNFYLKRNDLYWLRVHPQNIELLNLGNSHEMHGIRMFDKYKGVSHNFATSSQPFYYDYQLLKCLDEGSLKDSIGDAENTGRNIAENAIVLIPISLFDWYYNWPETFKDDTFTYKRRYYGLFPSKCIFHYNFDEDMKYNYLSVLTAKDNLKYLIEDVPLPRQDEANYTQNEEAVKGGAQWKYESWRDFVMKRTGEVKEENIKWFKKMVDLCYEKGYRPVIISTPIPYTLTEKFSNEFLLEFHETNKEVLKEYKDILFLDYSEDKEYTENLSFYRDTDHFNTYGADSYSWKILNDLVENGYISEQDLVTELE